jgi:hypothetical protein
MEENLKWRRVNSSRVCGYTYYHVPENIMITDAILDYIKLTFLLDSPLNLTQSSIFDKTIFNKTDDLKQIRNTLYNGPTDAYSICKLIRRSLRPCKVGKQIIRNKSEWFYYYSRANSIEPTDNKEQFKLRITLALETFDYMLFKNNKVIQNIISSNIRKKDYIMIFKDVSDYISGPDFRNRWKALFRKQCALNGLAVYEVLCSLDEKKSLETNQFLNTFIRNSKK